MDRAEAVRRIKEIQKLYVFTPTINEALDLAIEALQAEIIVRGETTIVPVGCKKQETCLDWEPLQGEKEELVKYQLSEETSTNEGVAESATTTDCVSRQAAIEAVKTVFCEMTPFGKKNTLIDILNHLPPATLQNISKPNNLPPVPPTDKVVDFKNMISADDRIRNLPPVNQKQVTSKLKNPDDSLLTADSDECKEQKSKLDCISRTDAMAYIDRILNSGLGKNKSLDYIRKYISAQPSVVPDYETFCGVPIKEAIEVLEKHKHSPSVTPTVSEDCISRQGAIEAVANHFMADALIRNPSASNDIEDWKKIAESVLSNLPPVTPTERTGEWVRHELWDMPWFTCSECNFHGRSDFKFCPNCGAKMGGDDNG